MFHVCWELAAWPWAPVRWEGMSSRFGFTRSRLQGIRAGGLPGSALATVLVGGMGCIWAAMQSQQRPQDPMHTPEPGWSCRAAWTDHWCSCPQGEGMPRCGGLPSNEGHGCESLATNIPGSWGSPHIGAKGSLGGALRQASCGITNQAPSGSISSRTAVTAPGPSVPLTPGTL